MESLNRGRCLIVEDEELTADFMKLPVESCGYEVAVANSLNDGLYLLAESYKKEQFFDLIITDGFLKWLPPKEKTLTNLHGRLIARAAKMQALNLIRKRPGYKPPAIVLVSGNDLVGTPEVDDQLHSHGLVLACKKPIDYDQLVILAGNVDCLRSALVEGYVPQNTAQIFSRREGWNILAATNTQEKLVV